MLTLSLLSRRQTETISNRKCQQNPKLLAETPERKKKSAVFLSHDYEFPDRKNVHSKKATNVAIGNRIKSFLQNGATFFILPLLFSISSS